MFDAVKNYLALANGVTEVTRQRAVSAAKALVASGEATAEQVSNLADDLLTTSRNNRDTVLALVRYEIDRALVRLGLATSEEISSLAQRLASASRPSGRPWARSGRRAGARPVLRRPAAPDETGDQGRAQGARRSAARPSGRRPSG